MLIDTHTHLQFKAFENNIHNVIKTAKDSGIEKMIVVGTNLETSKKAIELVEKYKNLYVSIGLHPHHVFPYCHSEQSEESIKTTLHELEQLLSNPKALAIGETGLDRHIYENTKYQNYQITEDFLNLQKLFFKEQIKLAIKHQKSLIIHNRESIPELLEILEANWHPFLEGRSVFHCCEPNQALLDFAIKHRVFIGIDGDITYDQDKQQFLKKIPLELLVLETDSPYFVPEPLRHPGESPVDFRVDRNPIRNEPKNLIIIAGFISQLLNIDLKTLENQTTKNSTQLFNIPKI